MPDAGIRLRVVSITTWEPPENNRVQPSVLGFTQTAPGKRGTRGYVFWRRVERASLAFTASLDKLLAVAIAHEIGHMLLPNGKHAKRGLMVAPWDASHFRAASAGLLAFSAGHGDAHPARGREGACVYASRQSITVTTHVPADTVAATSGLSGLCIFKLHCLGASQDVY